MWQLASTIQQWEQTAHRELLPLTAANKEYMQQAQEILQEEKKQKKKNSMEPQRK